MAWRNQSTSSSIDVELSDFTEEQLLQGLIDAKWISPTEAEAVMKRAASNESGHILFSGSGFDADLLDDARRALRRGNRSDAIHYIEHFLGREWIGVLQ